MRKPPMRSRRFQLKRKSVCAHPGYGGTRGVLRQAAPGTHRHVHRLTLPNRSFRRESRMTVRRFALPLAALLAFGTAALCEGSEEGQLAFNNACRTCHTVKEGDNRLGPNLHKIIGRKAGSLPGYGYSSAMKGADVVWDKATLDRFIANPDQVVSGNNMKPYGGLTSAQERANIIAYLEANGGS
jgi:cytochrome c